MINKCVIAIFVMGFISLNIFLPSLRAQDGGYDYRVKLDPEILKFFEENNSSSGVRIIVELKDESGIIVEGTKEERRDKLKQIDEWFKPEVDKIVSDYEGDGDIKVIRKGFRGFSAIVTEEGFWKLANDSRIYEIHHDAIVSGANNEGNITYNDLSEKETNTSEMMVKEANTYTVAAESEKSTENSKTPIIILLIVIVLMIISIKLILNRKDKKR